MAQPLFYIDYPCIFPDFSRDVAAGVRRQCGAEGLGLEARAGRGGAGRHHDRRAQGPNSIGTRLKGVSDLIRGNGMVEIGKTGLSWLNWLKPRFKPFYWFKMVLIITSILHILRGIPRTTKTTREKRASPRSANSRR